MTQQKIVYRYSDGNTYTDYDTKEEALEAKRLQNGGTVVKLVTNEFPVDHIPHTNS